MQYTIKHLSSAGRLTLLLILVSLASCSDDFYAGGAAGSDCVLSLSYKQLHPKEIRVSRATSAENALNNMQVFVFDKDEKLKGYRYIADADLLKQDGTVGNIDIKTKTGLSYIYAVANVPTSIYQLGTADKPIPTSEDDAWDEDEARDGEIDFTLKDLKRNPFMRQSGVINITEANFMMAGCANGGGICNIENVNGLATVTSPTESEDALIKLRRIVSKVKFMVTTESGITFTPQSYQIVNIPRQGQLVRKDNDESFVSPDGFETYTGTFINQNQETADGYTYNTFTQYLPENLHKAATASVSTWAEREDDAYDDDGNKTFTNAPVGSTYVVLSGNYDGPLSTDESVTGYDTQVQASVKYYIHLGDFGDEAGRGYRDFSVERNCSYTFKVTIAGVNSIKVEAEAEGDGYQSGAEGTVLSYATSNATVLSLDSHYAKIDMTFQKSLMPSDAFYVKVEDIRTDNTNNGFYTITADNITYRRNGEDLTVTSGEISNADWLEFADGSNQEYSALFTSGNKTNAKSIVDILQELLKNRDASSFWSSEKKTYTCFVNENYYTDRDWSEFINKDPRTVYIADKKDESSDGHSIYAEIFYGIEQKSIQTFYNTSYAGTTYAYGCEADANDNYGGNSYNYTNQTSLDTPLSLSTYTQGTGSSVWDGRSNMVKDLSSGSITKWSANSEGSLAYNSNYRNARLSCMSRNRDNNGNGTIDDDEIRWYCPTLEQYTGLLIGEDAMSAESHLFSGNTTALSEQSGDWTKRQGGTHYYCNDNRYDRFVWAEEGLSTSRNAGINATQNATPLYVRCVRNLQSRGTGTGITPAMFFNEGDVSNNVVNLSEINTNAVRTSYQTAELIPHDETSAINSPAVKFEVADELAKQDGTTLLTSMISATDSATTICSKYHKTAGDKWRAPNQKELFLMFSLGMTSDSRECSRTKFSNSDFRYSWECRYGQMQMLPYNDATQAEFTIRCVRDVK